MKPVLQNSSAQSPKRCFVFIPRVRACIVKVPGAVPRHRSFRVTDRSDLWPWCPLGLPPRETQTVACMLQPRLSKRS
eukprot:14471132-Heterocapsa_arctica.AAC.1